MPECLVLPGIGGVAVQGLLLACCVGVFYVKRNMEQKKLGDAARSKEEFFLDASKQFASAGWIHVMNLGFASALNSLMSGGDECEWYWINIMVDTTLGTAVAYFFLRIAHAFIRKKLSPTSAEDFKSGEYRGEDGIISMHKYGKQLTVWLLVITCMKVLMVLCMFLFSGPLLAFAGFILAPFLTQPWLKLLVVMIIFPLLMDGFQIWMIDNFIKRPETSFNEGAVQDLEVSDPYVEASAAALLVLSQRCEEATEETLLTLKARCDEAMHPDHERLQELDVKKDKMPPGANFETQYKFQTIIPPDQVWD